MSDDRMTQSELRALGEDLVWLVSCAVCGRVPDAGRVDGIDLAALYRLADKHMLTAAAAMALQSAGREDRAFAQARGKAVSKAAQLEMEAQLLLKSLEQAEIWYMPLKGALLQKLYPRAGMRQMSDVDVLFDADRAQDVREILERQGFTAKYFGVFHTDDYYKQPVCSIEMHRTLFETSDGPLHDYYLNVRLRLIKDEGNGFGFHFSPEDEYVYLIAHEFHHFSGSGTGLRSLLDEYEFLKHFGDDLDWAYVKGELEKLGIGAFEETNRTLALHLFGDEPLSPTEEEMLDFILSSGVYGRFETYVDREIEKHGKTRFFLRRLFLPYRIMTTLYPGLKKHPVLLPFYWIYRLVHGVIHKKGKIKTIIKAVWSTEKETDAPH